MLMVTQKAGHVEIRVRVQPGAPRNELIGELDGILKIKIAAPPVDGKANEACRKFIAALLDVSPSSVHVSSGARSRTKTITVRNISAEYAHRRLNPELRR